MQRWCQSMAWAMVSELMEMERGDRLWPFIHEFYGRLSSYLWEDDRGVTHDIPQGEGGEQATHAIFSLGLHKSLKSISDRLLSTKKVFVFLDDICLVCRPTVWQQCGRLSARSCRGTPTSIVARPR